MIHSRDARVDLFPWVLVLLLVAKSAALRWMTLGGPVAAAGVWLELPLIGIGMLAATLLPRWSRGALVLVYSVASVVLCANAVYAGYFRQLFDPGMIALARQYGEGDVTRVALDIFRPAYWPFIADIPFVIFAAFRYRTRRAAVRRLPVAAALAIALVAFGMQVWRVQSTPYGIDTTSLAAGNGIGATQMAALAAAWGIGASDTDAEAPDPTAGGRAPNEGDFTRVADFAPGAYEGLSVVIVQVESLQTMLVNGSVQGKLVAPNFRRIAKESWYFPNTYSQTGAGNTSDAEFIVNTGLLPPLTRPASVDYVDREIAGLPRMLRAQGYDAFTMHTNIARFWNRRELYPALGFTRYFDRTFFGLRDMINSRPSDAILFKEALKLLKDREASGKGPVLLETVTVTTHAPFEQPPAGRRPLVLKGGDANSYAGRYVTSFSFVDSEFGKFVDGLRDAGLLDKVILVVFGDHTGYQESFPAKEDENVLRSLLGREYGYLDRQRIPVLVRLPGGKGRVVEDPRAMTDIMPGIVDLLGLDATQAPNVGTSLFLSGRRVIPARYYYPGGTVIAGTVLYVNDGSFVSAYDVLTNTEITDVTGYEAARDEARTLNARSNALVGAMPEREANPLGDATVPGRGKWDDDSERE